MTLDASGEQYTSVLVEEFGDALRTVAFGDADADEYEIRQIRDDSASPGGLVRESSSEASFEERCSSK